MGSWLARRSHVAATHSGPLLDQIPAMLKPSPCRSFATDNIVHSAEIEDLNAKAAKARRLAMAIGDPTTIDALEAYADECDGRAVALHSRPDNRH